MQKIPKISVIIPVYNAQDYLNRCLDSVCNQTLKDIEIICVNDCSIDASAKILHEYSENYPHLKVLHLEKNLGESGARNTGLALAKGEYLAFVDNDDEIDLNFYEKLYEKAKESDADIVKGQAIEIDYNGNQHIIKQLRPEDHKLLFINYWWCAIYKRSLIIENNISFPINCPLGGDILFLSNAVIAARNLQLVEDVFYHYYRREDSGDSKMLSAEKIKSALTIFEVIIDNVSSKISDSDPVYTFIFHHFIINAFYLSIRTEDKELKELSARISIKIFEKCQKKDALKINFLSNSPHLFIFLQNGDFEALIDAIIKSKSRAELISSGLRNRIKMSKLKVL
jgi:glycosyltransferase involved in cell wall biosynthesis